jgi:hypothetical protein
MAKLIFRQTISGEGNTWFYEPMGCRIDLHPLPSKVGMMSGDPAKLIDAGIVGWGQMGGWHGFERLEFMQTTLAPAPPAVSGIRWVLPPGVTADLYAIHPRLQGE